MTRPVFLVRELCKQLEMILFNVRTPWKQIPMEEMEWVGEKLPLTVFEDLARFQQGGLVEYELLNALPNSIALRSLMREYNIELIMNFSNITLANLKPFWGRKIPMITDFYDWLPDMITSKYFPEANSLSKWLVERSVYLLMKRVFDDSQLITASSASLKDLISRTTHRPVDLVSNGVDTTLFHPLSEKEIKLVREEQSLECDVLIGTVMTVWFPGVLDDAIHAVSSLNKKGVDIRLLVIGTGPLLSYYQDFVRQNNLEKSVRFLGLQPYHKVARLLGATDACLMPLGKESIYYQTARHFKLLEFLALGKPVISPRLVEVQRMFPADGGPVLFASSTEEMVKAILRIRKNPTHIIQLGLKGRELMEQRFDWKIVSKSMSSRIHSFLP